MLCGDFNFKEIDWVNQTVDGSEESEPVTFYETCQEAYLHQHVTEFTRSRGTDTPSLLDLVFTKDELDIDSIDYCAPIGASDHAVLIFPLWIEGDLCHENDCLNKLNYYKGNYVKANELFANIDWAQEFADTDVNEMWNRFIHR